MLILLLATLAASAGEIVVDAKVPVRFSLDGQLAAELYVDSRLRLPVSEGAHVVVVTTNGEPRRFDVEVGTQPVVVLVGRTGTTVGAEPSTPTTTSITGPVDVNFRTIGSIRLLLQIDQQRIVVPPGAGIDLPLELGEHEVSVRNLDGTQIFARGILTVNASGDNVVQLAEGRVPEVAGQGLAFDATGQ